MNIYIKVLSAWIIDIPTIITTCYEICIQCNIIIQLQSCYDSRGRAWVNTFCTLYHALLCLTQINIHTYKILFLKTIFKAS